MGGPLAIPKAVRGAFLDVGPRRATLAHFLALSAWAPRAAERHAPSGQVARAARILDLPPEEALAWTPRGREASAALPRGLRGEVAERIADAFATALPLREGGAPSGLGWWVELLHLAVAEFRFPLREALGTPVSQLFCLAAAHAAAHGAKFSAPAYEEADLLDELPDAALPVAGDGLDGDSDRNPEECRGRPEHESVPPPKRNRRDEARQRRDSEKPTRERIDVHAPDSRPPVKGAQAP